MVGFCRACGVSLTGRPGRTRFCLLCLKARKIMRQREKRRALAKPPRPLCQGCQERPPASRTPGKAPHPNATYCAACRQARRKAPPHKLTDTQILRVRELAGTKTRQEIADTVGCSMASLQRWARAAGVSLRSNAHPPDVVDAVISYYESHGKAGTQQLFPETRVRSIVERHPHQPRQMRWTDDQLVDAVRMAGLVSHSSQAAYFNRPNANDGSIQSLWAKRFEFPPTSVNGLPSSVAWELGGPGLTATLVWHHNVATCSPKVLWLDLAAHLRPDLPEWIQAAVRSLARFQAWLHGTENPGDIRQMIEERERGRYRRFAEKRTGRQEPRTEKHL